MHNPTVETVPPARHLLRARDLADSRYAEPLGVKDLARASGLSSAHFSREFKRTFGESPHQYLMIRRLERIVLRRSSVVSGESGYCSLMESGVLYRVWLCVEQVFQFRN